MYRSIRIQTALLPRRASSTTITIAVMWFILTGSLMAQGVLLGPGPLPRPWHPPHERPAMRYEISKVALRARVRQQLARVTVEQTFVNTGSRPIEASFVFPLPTDGAIEEMTFLVDGREMPGKLLSADEANRIYQTYVRQYRDPALLQWIGHGMFRTSVFPIPPGKSRTVQIRYSQLCSREFGLTEVLLPMRTMQFTHKPIKDLTVSLAIEADEPIKNIYSPSHPVSIKRPRPEEARVTWEAHHAVPTDDFRLFYDMGKNAVSTQVVSYRASRDDDGYFLMLISPDLPKRQRKPQPKNVIFVLDRSGSMSGKKIEQARSALKFVLGNLRQGDLFNIVAYDSQVEAFRPELQRYDENTLDEALSFVSGIEAGGSTNIHDALRQAMAMVPDDDSRPAYVVFLTDGRPTVGVTQEAKIAEAAEQANDAGARLYCFGLGYDVNSRLLDKLARANHGYTVYVRPNEDIEASVAKLYRRIEAPALVNVQLTIDVNGRKPGSAPATYRVYPREITDLFAGDQLVVVGRYRQPGKAHVTIRGDLVGKPQTYEFDGRFVRQSKDNRHAYVEKLWAVRRVGEIIDEIDLHGKNDELVDELVALAKRHGILTPYTSFLADETKAWGDVAGAKREALHYLADLDRAAGRAGFVQRQRKAELQRADQAAAGLGGYAGPAPAGASSDPYAAPQAQRGGGTGGGGGFGGGFGPSAAPVRQVGPWTFYWRKGKWIDSRVNTDKAQPSSKLDKLDNKTLEFVQKYGSELGQALALPGPVVIMLDKKIYEFTDDTGKPDQPKSK